MGIVQTVNTQKTTSLGLADVWDSHHTAEWGVICHQLHISFCGQHSGPDQAEVQLLLLQMHRRVTAGTRQ